MPVFYCSVDTSIYFTRDEYYLKFKNREIKYLPGKGKTQDLLLFKMDELGEEQSFSLIMELLSSLSFGLDAIFDSKGGFINHLAKFNWKDIHSQGGNLVIFPHMRLDDFIHIRPLKDVNEIQLARLYRTALASNNIYTQILFFWHCLCYPEKEVQAVNLINQYYKNIPKEMEADKKVADKILQEHILHTGKVTPNSLGDYIKEGIRHSIAHFTRFEDIDQKGFELDSLKELRHLHEVRDILKGMSRYRMEYDWKMKRPDESQYCSYFTP